jgi:maleylacetate reductase
LPAEADRLGLKRLLLLSTAGHAHRAREAASLLGDRTVGAFTNARMHTPVDVTAQVMTEVASHAIDGTVAIGGGSAIGLAKAIALRTDLPQIVVPTTYAGSEATAVLGETRDGRKKTVRDARILPEVVIYDVALTRSLPVALSVASGLNAIAHAVEGLYARDGNPLSSLLAEDGIRSISAALRAIVKDPGDDDARASALYGAWLSGMVLGATSMALHHKLCHVLGGAFNLSHADTHAILLPHVIAHNTRSAPEAMSRVARALGGSPPADSLFNLLASGGGPTALRDIGLPESGIDTATDLLIAEAPWNPRPVTRGGVRGLLERAWRGDRPQDD